MTWTIPTPEIIKSLRSRDGDNYYIPQEFLNNLLMDEFNTVYFPVYAIDGRQVGWNSRSAKQKRWSQTLNEEPTPRFTSWTPEISSLVYGHRKICLTEGSYDALAFAPVLPWTISTNTARVMPEILEWCIMWKLHVFTALDLDLVDPKTGKAPGQIATTNITKRLTDEGCKVTRLRWPEFSAPPFPVGVHIKDPGQAYALMGSSFHEMILSQVRSVI